MGFDESSKTRLVLGLGISSTLTDAHISRKLPAAAAPQEYHIDRFWKIHEPNSLTLSLCGEHHEDQIHEAKTVDFDDFFMDRETDNLFRQADHNSTGDSSLSNLIMSVKREREHGSCEEVEIQRISCGEDEGFGGGRKKLRLNKIQSARLEDSFNSHSSTLNPKQKQELARELKLRPRQVEVWFQNRRARTKLKQTELDCEFSRKCCDRLTDENRRLHKELKELKALKSTQPLYMQLPPATLTMCPSCERINHGGGGGGVAENGSKSSYTIRFNAALV